MSTQDRFDQPALSYPYLVVRYFPSVYHRESLEAWLSREQAIARGWEVMDEKERRFRCCVVFGPADAVYLEPDGSETASRSVPSGGVVLKDE